jgi:hypothetical protein
MPPRSSIYPVVFFVSLALWTVALLIPLPHESARRVLGSAERVFAVHKLVHVFAYAFLTILGGLMTRPTWQRWALLGLLSFHGFATEFLQLFVERGASWIDVGIDHVGILLGLAVSWPRWWALLAPRPIHQHSSSGDD